MMLIGDVPSERPAWLPLLLSGKRLRRRGIVASVIAAVLASLGTATPAAADFCDSQVIHDYTKVLERLPAIPSPPLDEHPDFAPARIFLSHHTFGPLQLGRGKRGFELTFGPSEEGSSASPRVNWQVTSRLVKLNRRGRRIGRPRMIEKHVTRLRAVDLDFEISGKPAIYRLEIVFENGRGERLGRFGEYFRVLQPSLDVDIFLNGTTFHRGEQVQAWLVNRGVAVLSFGLFKTIEYDDGGTWTNPPVAFPGGPVPAIGLAIGPGVKTSCWTTTVPSDAALGLYRFATQVDHSTKEVFGSNPLDLGAKFTVVE
jgi:hypothetical protein